MTAGAMGGVCATWPRVAVEGSNSLDTADKAGRSVIHCGDVVTVLDALPPARQFDVIIADPPYNIGKDFGTNNDTIPLSHYVAWSHRWLAQCFARLTAHGVMYVYGFAEILARVAVHYPPEQQRWLVWHYTNKAAPSARFWQRSHESILCLWRLDQPRPRLHIDQIREPYTAGYLGCVGRPRAATASRFNGDGRVQPRTTTYQAHANGALPRDVIKIPALAGGAGASERWFMCHDCGDAVFPPAAIKHHRQHAILKHPTQKPTALARRLIRSRIAGCDGHLLIPFAGSGAECVVAQAMQIPFLGIEINPQFVDFAHKWLAQTRHAALPTTPARNAPERTAMEPQ